MQLEETRVQGKGSFRDYFEVIKPRETGLLVFIGGVTALVAAGGQILPGRLLFILAAVLIASAGANGLTNYLDRNLDARMQRTRHRVLPSRKISPPERVLFFTAGLTAVGLVMAWFVHPYAFLADAVGTAAAVIYRKRVTCVFPQGVIASSAPVLMGWFAVKSSVSWEIILLCVLIAAWLPSHIWSIMLAYKEDYRKAGITYFPVDCSTRVVVKILFGFSLLLYAASMGLYFAGRFGHLYLGLANILGIIIIYASGRLLVSRNYRDAWRLYRLSAFPYLGILFLVMGLDIWWRF